jgi:membrane-bound lytic murein transglycosylase F
LQSVKKLSYFLYCLIFFILTSCTFFKANRPLPPPEILGELVVAVLEAPGFFQQEGETMSGFEYDLTNQFANSLGVTARYVSARDINQLSELLTTNKVHLVASLPNDSNTPNKRTHFSFSPPLRSVSYWVVGRDDTLGQNDLAALYGHTVAIIAGSPLAQRLATLDEKSRPVVVEIPGQDELTLLSQVSAQKIPLAAVSDIALDLASNFYPELTPLVGLPGKTGLSWAYPPPPEDRALTRTMTKPITQPLPLPEVEPLSVRANAFIEEAQKNGTIARLNDRYFGNVRRINSVGIAQFIKDSQTLLPKFRQHFHAAQNLTGIDWRLLAALAYQESHWDPLATSPTNVRGMMMLTEETANHLGVDNRLDAASSIQGGARYLESLIEQLPDNIQPPDRLWLALAGYNLGMGHLRGALAIAKDMEYDPTSWYEMKKVLPLLSKPAVYDRLKAGPARGGEAVILVENIRTYYTILQHLAPTSEASAFDLFRTTKSPEKSLPAASLTFSTKATDAKIASPQSAGQVRRDLFAPAHPSTGARLRAQ